MSPDQHQAAAARLRLALDLFGAGEALKRQQLRRNHPGLDAAAIEALIVQWLRERPGAEHGDAAGRPCDWHRRRP